MFVRPKSHKRAVWNSSAVYQLFDPGATFRNAAAASAAIRLSFVWALLAAKDGPAASEVDVGGRTIVEVLPDSVGGCSVR